jgi:hypothetical protein
MVYWGKEFERFSNIFMPFWAVVSLGNLKGISIGQAHAKGKGQHVLEFAEEFVWDSAHA